MSRHKQAHAVHVHEFDAGRLFSQSLFTKTAGIVLNGARDELQAEIADTMANQGEDLSVGEGQK